MTSRSATSGSERNDESMNAMTNRPGAPRPIASRRRRSAKLPIQETRDYTWEFRGAFARFVVSSRSVSCFLKLEVDRKQIVESAEIDCAAGESLVAREIALRMLIPDLAADPPLAEGHAHAAEDDGPDRAAAAGKRAAEDAVVGRVDELARLLVAPREHADAGAQVRNESALASDGQPSNRRRERHDAQLQVLLDLGAVGVDQIGVHARDRA